MKVEPSAANRTASSQRRRMLTLHLTVMCCLAVLTIAVMPGCGGCLQTEDPLTKKQKEEEEKRRKAEEEKRKPKKDFEVIGRLDIQPSDESLTASYVKPGHWIECVQQMRANNFDCQAELESEAVDSKTRPVEIEHTPFRMLLSRPASLPKGQVKHFEMTYFVPRLPGRETNKKVWLSHKLRWRRTGREIPQGSGQQPTTTMPDYQFFFVVLSSDPDRYGYLKRAPSIIAPTGGYTDEDSLLYYRVVLPKIDRRVPLPTHPLTWTSIAYVLWDDLPPSLLTPDQQQAIIDWIHFGGQLIVSGPNSLDALRDSFLGDYLPAQKGQTIELNQEAFAELNENWALPNRREPGTIRTFDVLEGRPLIGAELIRHAEADELEGTGGLVLERRIGRGRIAVTAFSMSDRQMRNWDCFDSFFNACLLRRPNRYWRDTNELLGPQVNWDGYSGYEKDARLASTVRYVTRDLGYLGFVQPPPTSESLDFDQTGFGFEPLTPQSRPPVTQAVKEEKKDAWHFGGYQTQTQSGVGGWNDNSGVASAVRESLKDAAGISVPKASFVLRVLAIYLVVLVPVNWGFFRLIGRVEWAWIAAPVIAILGALAVVRFAQLDIGFVRSRTEIAVLEAHGGYDRAHLTRYTALYTSLSTGYDFSFEDDTALAQPFAVDAVYQRQSHEVLRTVYFQRDKDLSLRGFNVDSNSTGIVHAEQIYNLGGSVQLTGDASSGFTLQNNSDLTLKDVGILYKIGDEQIQMAWVGTLKSKTSTSLSLSAPTKETPRFPQWDESPTTTVTGKAEQGEVRLGRLVQLATQQLEMRQGEARLVGWTDDALSGVSIRPQASQVTTRTFVLIHLRPGQLPEPRPDRNVKADLVDPKDDEDKDSDDKDPMKNDQIPMTNDQ